MKISELQDGQIVTLRTGRAGRHAVEWGMWRPATLYIQRNKKGEVVVIAIKSEGWAEYSPRDWNPPFDGNPHGTFVAEDYYMEIEGVEK